VADLRKEQEALRQGAAQGQPAATVSMAEADENRLKLF
jgi:hypothetical protein